MTKLKSLTLLGHGFARSVPAFGEIPILKSQTPKLKEANAKLQGNVIRYQELQFSARTKAAVSRRNRWPSTRAIRGTAQATVWRERARCWWERRRGRAGL